MIVWKITSHLTLDQPALNSGNEPFKKLFSFCKRKQVFPQPKSRNNLTYLCNKLSSQHRRKKISICKLRREKIIIYVIAARSVSREIACKGLGDMCCIQKSRVSNRVVSTMWSLMDFELSHVMELLKCKITSSSSRSCNRKVLCFAEPKKPRQV